MDRRAFSTVLMAMAFYWARGRRASADDLDAPGATGGLPGKSLPNLWFPTAGGRQFWGDELFFHGWHIQRNALTNHCRLLDDRNRRHAWGTFEQCQAKLAEIKDRQKLPRMSGRAVVLLHGILRSSTAMSGLGKYLRSHGDYTVFNVTYPTTRSSILTHAERLAKIVSSLDGIDELNFVGHSLGNLVIRGYLGSVAAGQNPDARLKRIVMIAPPNNGAKLADLLDQGELVHRVAGDPAREMSQRGWSQVAPRLATPACEFGIIAGGLGNPRGYNPLLGEDNDMVLSVETTRLPGAADFTVVPVIHSIIKDDPKVQEYTLRFLNRGYFVAADRRQPIAAAVTRGTS
jgi:pimeloyl-ACP methyl ester carboxylesterase